MNIGITIRNTGCQKLILFYEKVSDELFPSKSRTEYLIINFYTRKICYFFHGTILRTIKL